MYRRGNRRTGFPFMSFQVINRRRRGSKEIPVQLSVHDVLMKVKLGTVVCQDSAQCAVIPRQEFLILFLPPRLGFSDRFLVGSIRGVRFDKESHTQHITTNSLVAVFPTCCTSALVALRRGRPSGRVGGYTCGVWRWLATEVSSKTLYMNWASGWRYNARSSWVCDQRHRTVNRCQRWCVIVGMGGCAEGLNCRWMHRLWR